MAPRAKSRGRRRVNRSRRIVRLPTEYFAAMDAANVLFPALYQFENGLRIALDSFLQTCYGSDWWNASLKGRLSNTFFYAEEQRKKLDAMPWIGDSSAVQ